MKQTKQVEEMDCMDDLMFELEEFGNFHRDDCRSNFTYDTDETPEDCDCDMRGLKPFFRKAIATAVKEEHERIVDEINGILNPLWKGRLSYASRPRYDYRKSQDLEDDLQEIEGVVTKLVLYLTKHYHKQPK